MQQRLGGLQQQLQLAQGLPLLASGRVPPPPSPLLQQRTARRHEAPLLCRARKPQTDVAEAATSGSLPAAQRLPPPPLSQQHAQPPRPGTQQAQLGGPAPLGRQSAAPVTRQPAPHRTWGQQAAAPQPGTTLPPSAVEQPQLQQQQQQQQQQPGRQASPPADPTRQQQQQQQQPNGTQLIFRFERRGEGWAEEILPHLVVEQRPLALKKKRAYSRPDPWKEGSLECYLVELGVPPDDVDRVVTLAVAWRVTPGGRSLIDRRRRSRVERNVRLVVEHLELECGVPFGPKGIAAILQRCPEIMLCKPTTNDRWDRRAVELSAYLLHSGHCNVPEDWEENPELGLWVKRQRIARAAGQLSDERLSILQSMGFAFGEVAQLTEEWEHRFDQLVDWLLWHNENNQPFNWLGVDWGARGGITARELALWTTLQREYRARGLLPGEALSRFDAIGVQWDSVEGHPMDRRWMSWFGRLLYVIERHNTQSRGAQAPLPGRRKMGRPRGTGAGGSVDVEGEPGAAGSAADAEVEEDVEGEEEEEEEEGESLRPDRQRGRGSAAVAAARLRLQAEVAARRAALASADLRSEPGLRFWLERQRRRWRRQELPAELELMLQLAGVQLDTYSPAEWQATAHAAAALLQGSAVRLGARGVHPAVVVEPAAAGGAAQAAQQQQQQQQPAPEAAAEAAMAQQQRAPAGAQPQACPSGSLRLRVGRWVLTQQALFAENKLSPAQLRYLAFLGITWLLSVEVTLMPQPVWQQWCERLAAAPRPPPPGSELAEWLQHQRGLAALGWLPPKRRAALVALQVSLDTFDRGPSDEEWDLRLSELLAFKAEHGHCQVAAAGAQPRWAALAAWLAEQHRAAAAARLPPPRAAQLAAIGAVPASQRRQQQQQQAAGA